MKIDNFALTMFQTCPAKYKLRMVDNWTSRRKSAALGFGGALHLGLAEWYRTGEAAKALVAINEGWPEGLPVDDWRTKEKCLTVMTDYIRAYPRESFTVLGAPEAPMVENTFTIATGMYLRCKMCQHLDTSLIWEPQCSRCGMDKEEIEYGGIFDTLVNWDDNIYVLEHKTTSMLGTPPHSYYFAQYKPNNQVTGYIWGGQGLSGRPVKGAIINAIGINKSSATKFARTITTRSDEQIKRWMIDLQATCQQIFDADVTGVWPLHTPACTLYGKCEFHEVHVLGSEREQQAWLEQQYMKKAWDFENRDDEGGSDASA